MVKRHLKRIATPSSWPIERKGTAWVTRPNPGAHTLDDGISNNTIIKEILKFAKTTKEVKNILQTKKVLINGKQRKDTGFMVGVLDTIEFPEIGEAFRITLTSNKKLKTTKIDVKEVNLLPAKIVNKTKLKGGKIQLNLSSGKNMLVDKDNFKTQDTLIIELPKQKIKETIEFKPNNLIYLIGGKHTGCTGKLLKIEGNTIEVEINKEKYNTLKRFAIAIGKDKPSITV